MTILSLNCGSSSLKFALFAREGEREGGLGAARLAEGAVERIGEATGRAWLRHGAARVEQEVACRDHAAALHLAFGLLSSAGLPEVTIAGHRVVHGGPTHVAPALVDGALLASLRALTPLSPLHMPAALAGIDAVSALHPRLPQVACFDTAFHQGLPEVARRLPLPDRFNQDEVRRYGFHGLSYEYVLSTLRPVPARLVIAHLGNGASLVAVRDGRSVDTTMGLTPTGGVPMGTRTGDLDPGVLLYLARRYRLDLDALERLVDREAGLLAIGGTADMKTLLLRAPDDPRARLAVDLFGYAIRKAIGAYAAALGGLELLVFTGGIGERAPAIRAEACRGLEFLGVALEPGRNQANEPVISARGSRAEVRVVATDEDLVIARHARRLLLERPGIPGPPALH